jgi:hypothetical protein
MMATSYASGHPFRRTVRFVAVDEHNGGIRGWYAWLIYESPLSVTSVGIPKEFFSVF